MTMEKYTCKDFPVTGILRIPKKFQVILGLQTGRCVDIAYEEKMIFIRRENPKSFHNKRLISEKGYIKIPKEIIDIANITSEDEYCLYLDDLNKQLVVKI
ncbi:hypothetical protein [Paenisporosarcina indica]|uniref:hypothetical protein n=1 Tax=Paenisporosarcina indica TaxID=650093 RepID=UPI000A0546DE|nr:hypothetical protein [Paenisporosarcina indica]